MPESMCIYQEVIMREQELHSTGVGSSVALYTEGKERPEKEADHSD